MDQCFLVPLILKLILVSGLLIQGRKYILESMKHGILFRSSDKSSPNFHQGFVNLHLDTYVFKNQFWLSWIHTGFLPVNLNQGRACHALATKEAFYFGKLTKVMVSTIPEQLSLGKSHPAEATTYPGHTSTNSARCTSGLRQKWVSNGHVQTREGWRYLH